MEFLPYPELVPGPAKTLLPAVHVVKRELVIVDPPGAALLDELRAAIHRAGRAHAHACALSARADSRDVRTAVGRRMPRAHPPGGPRSAASTDSLAQQVAIDVVAQPAAQPRARRWVVVPDDCGRPAADDLPDRSRIVSLGGRAAAGGKCQRGKRGEQPRAAISRLSRGR